MQKTKLMVAVLGALCAMPVLAADAPAAPASSFTPSANVGIFSDYIFRGVTQTGKNPALQGGFDLAHASGAYVGVWSSSISWLGDGSPATATKAGTEFDTYAGYKGEVVGIGYDVGALKYNYPGDYGTNLSADTTEVYGAISYSIVSVKYSYSLGDLFGTANSKGSTYLEVNASYPIEAAGISLGAHYGKTTVANNSTSDYADYKVSVSKDFGGYGLGLVYNDTDQTGHKATTIGSLSRAF
jgi:uncharacterized protein (TIGR02001 family)